MSDRNKDSVSNRALLTNALESTVTNEIEKKTLDEYKEELGRSDALERELHLIRSRKSEFKGIIDQDTKKILETRETEIVNSIALIDKKLLRLEATKPLQDIIHREKEKVYKRAEQKGKEALAEYREQAIREQEEILEKWREDREKAIQKRKEMLEKQRSESKWLEDLKRDLKEQRAEQERQEATQHAKQEDEMKKDVYPKQKKNRGIVALCITLAILVVGLSVAMFFSIKHIQETVAESEYTITFYNNKGIYFVPSGKLITKYQDNSVYKVVKCAEHLSEPTPPTNKGYVFLGWYQNPECTERFLFSHYEINGNINLYAKWGNEQ